MYYEVTTKGPGHWLIGRDLVAYQVAQAYERKRDEPDHDGAQLQRAAAP